MALYNLDITVPFTPSPDPANSAAPRASVLNFSRLLRRIAVGEMPGTAAVATATEGVKASGTVTLASCPAGAVVEINGQDFVAISGTATSGNNEFDISGSDTADAVALAAAITASTSAKIANVVTATSALGVVTVSAARSGLGGNSVTIKTGGIRASGTVTYVTPSGAQTIVINGVTVYSATAGATAAVTATAAAAAINASSNALILGHVKALARAGVVYIYAAYDGPQGNAITTSATGTGATADQARLAGGTEASGNGAAASGTVTIAAGGSGTYTVTINGVAAASAVAWNTNETTTAADLVTAIRASTNALVQGVVTATSSSAVITVSAIKGGVSGNVITLAASGSVVTPTVSGARLASGAVPTTVVPNAARLASGTATYTTFSF